MNCRRSTSVGSLFYSGTATATLLLLGTTTTVLLGHQVHAATPVQGGVGVPSSPDVDVGVGSEPDADMHVGNYMSTTGVDQERSEEQEHAEITTPVVPGEHEEDKEHHSHTANVFRSAPTAFYSNIIGNMANRGPSAISNTIGNLANRFRRKRKAGEAGLIHLRGTEASTSSTSPAPTSPDRESQSAPSPVAVPEYHPTVVGDLLDDDLPDAEEEKSMMKDQDADIVLDAADVVLRAGDVLEGPLADDRHDDQGEGPDVAARTSIAVPTPVENEETERMSPLDDDELERRVKRQRTDTEGVFIATTTSAAPASPSPSSSSSSSSSGPPTAHLTTEETEKLDEVVRMLVEKNFSPDQIVQLMVHRAVLMVNRAATASDIEVNSPRTSAAGPAHVHAEDVPVVEHGEHQPVTEIVPEVEQDTPLVTSTAGEMQDAPAAATHGTTTEESMEVEMVAPREEHQEPDHLEKVGMEAQHAQEQLEHQFELEQTTTVPGTSLDVPDEHQEVAAAASSSSTGQVSSEDGEQQQTGGSVFAPVRTSTQRAGNKVRGFFSWFQK
ncbi:unnamed protein product [Amoebophrya sp. A120]|nr:unnamed protein product [Amoebophrya sp. A120]|eukprot:GSA120T00019667001.1